MNRYAKITEKFPREFLLLKGTGCFHKKCLFCDYYLDADSHPFDLNREILDMVTGEFGTLDIINSGSVHEFDQETLCYIQKIVIEKKISTLWFEAHFAYHRRLFEIRQLFPNTNIKFRSGIESFDHSFRLKMNKGIPDVSPKEIRRHFDGICLLVGVDGQTKEIVERDIYIAADLFEYFSVNIFCENTTSLKRDKPLIDWFIKEVYPVIKGFKNCEVLIDNTDLGVG